MNRLSLTLSFAICILVGHLGMTQELQWQSDVDLAKNMAAQEGKLVLLHFTAEWCRPCKQLKTFVFPSPNVISTIQERCIPVLVDTDENPELVKQYDVESIPMDIVITAEGRVLQKRKSPKDATNFVRMLKAVDSADTQYAERTAVISKKIGDVLQEIETGADSNKLAQNNDFSVKAPTATRPETGKDGKLLLSKSKTRLVEHVADVNEPANVTTQTEAGPQRVINDRFFAAKSHPNQQDPAQSNSNSQLMTPTATPTVEQSEGMQKFVRDAASAQSQQLQLGGREPMGITAAGEFVPVQSRQPQPSATDDQQPVEQEKQVSMPTPAEQVARAENRARVLQKVEEVPGTIEVDTVRENLARDANGELQYSAKIVPSENTEPRQSEVLRQNLLRSDDISIPDLVRGTSEVDLRDSVQKMFSGSPKTTVTKPPQAPTRIGLGGKCPVSLVEDGEWVAGNKNFGCVHRGRTYLFGNARKLVEFQRSPERYSPILAGFDPVVFHNQGELVEGAENHGVFMGRSPEQRIVLFQSQESRDEFQSNPKKYMATVRLAIKQSDAMR